MTTAAAFRKTWLEKLRLPTWPVAEPPRAPLGHGAELTTAIDFLVGPLPQLLQAQTDPSFADLAAAYGWVCVAWWQGTSPFPHPLPDYAQRLRATLQEQPAPVPPDVAALASLLRGHPRDGECGLNRLLLDDAASVAAHEQAVATGDFERYLTPAGAEKFAAYQRHLESSPAFAADWAKLRHLFGGDPAARWPDLVVAGKLRRHLLPERNWHTVPWWSFANERDQFRVAFEVLCWKWFLWAVEGNRPLLLKPSVTVTPFGTQIFVPGYLSLDFKRDLNLPAISRLHKARGVQRQSVERARVRELAWLAHARGESALAAVRRAFPHLDDRQLRRWL